MYADMNLGAFAVVIAVARKTKSGDFKSYGGLSPYAFGLTVVMSAFLLKLAGIPRLGGEFAAFYIFRSVLDSGTTRAVCRSMTLEIKPVTNLFYYVLIAC